MRDILFRGKTMYGRWVEGSLVVKTDSLYGFKIPCIVMQESGRNGILEPTLTWHSVKPETVGQYTGLTGKNGQRIFEGDILKVYDGRVGVVVYDARDAGYGLKGHGDGCCLCVSEVWEREVIGNIHDNPELIGGATDENAQET